VITKIFIYARSQIDAKPDSKLDAGRQSERATPEARPLAQFISKRPSWFQHVPRRLQVQTNFGFPVRVTAGT
jgi:hypothetical protein